MSDYTFTNDYARGPGLIVEPNVAQTRITATHVPTGLSVTVEYHRSQLKNKLLALAGLEAMVRQVQGSADTDG